MRLVRDFALQSRFVVIFKAVSLTSTGGGATSNFLQSATDISQSRFTLVLDFMLNVIVQNS